MTAISILRAIASPAANPLKTDTDSPNSSPAPESGFRGQLDNAIQAWEKVGTKDTTQGGASDEETREPTDKNEDHPQLPALVAVVAAILPTPPPASIGLPAIGPEPGSSSDGGSNQTETAAKVEPASEASERLSINPPPPPAETARPDLKADLAFAMRLVSVMPNREAASNADASKRTQPAPRLEICPQVEPAPALLADAATEEPNLGPVPTVLRAPGAPPEASRRSDVEIQPGRGTTTALQSAVPAIYRAARQDSPAADSEPRRFDGSGSGKEPAAQSPKPTPLGLGDMGPEIELKPFRESGATPASPNSAHGEIPSPMPGPLQTAVVSDSTVQTAAPAAPETTPVAEHIAAAPVAIRNNPNSEVTDVSVTLPRSDSAGEDRVAIRLVQKGAEIHVSVRTPDHQLSQTLRQDIVRLATGLDEAGFRTETWRPVVNGGAASSHSSPSHEFSQGAPNRDTPGSDARSGGREGRSPGEQKRRQPDERPRWVLEFEQHKNQ